MNFVKQAIILCAGLLTASSAGAQFIHTFAGKNSLDTVISGDNGPATDAGLGFPYGVAVDAAGNVYTSSHGYIRKINTSGIISAIAGNGVPGYTGDGGPATAAQVGGTLSLAADGSGNIYIADLLSNVVRKIDAVGIISTIAGNGLMGFSGDGGVAVDSALLHPASVAVDAVGNVYFGDYSSRVRKISKTGILTTVAGMGYPDNTGDGGPATAANIGFPLAIQFDASGKLLYIMDRLYGVVRRVSPGGIIITVAGVPGNKGLTGYSGDHGPATAALFNNPTGLALDASGNMFIADNLNNVVRKINTSGIISTYAGDGYPGYSGDGGPAGAAMIQNVWNLATDAYGRLYLADVGNHVIRMVDTTSDSAPMPLVKADTVFGFCENGTSNLDVALSVSDADMGQTETWSVYAPPKHGSLTGFPVMVASTGGVLMPPGISYAPAAGYVGTDTFVVTVSDGTSAFVKRMAVNVQPTNAGIVGISTPGRIGDCEPSGLSDSVKSGVWTVTGASMIFDTILYPKLLTPGWSEDDTITYTVANSCGVYTATLPIKIVICEKVDQTYLNTEQLKISPNPSAGTFIIDMPDNALTITVSDIMGRVITAESVTKRTGSSKSFDMSGRPAGNYIIKVTTADKVFTGRLELR